MASTRRRIGRGSSAAQGRRASAPASGASENASTFDDPREPLGIRLDASVAGELRRIGEALPALVLPLSPAIVAVATPGLPPDTLLDDSRWMLIPGGAKARLRTTSRVAQVLILTPHPLLEALVRQTYSGEVEPREMQRFLATPKVLPRTRWTHEIAHRYLFERHRCQKRDNDATRFLEVEILKEWYFLRLDDERAARRRAHLEGEDPLVERATRWIDENLAERVTVARIARAVHASQSALLRAFQRELRQAPGTYLRTRRLDEAMLLLRSGLPVGDVADRVGYASVTAFAEAFRARFGITPSSAGPR